MDEEIDDAILNYVYDKLSFSEAVVGYDIKVGTAYLKYEYS